MTLNDLERRNGFYFAFFPPNLTDFQADYITVVEDRPIMSVKYCLPVPVFYFWRKLERILQRGLSAIAEHLVIIISVAIGRRLPLTELCGSSSVDCAPIGTSLSHNLQRNFLIMYIRRINCNIRRTTCSTTAL